jgi:hypothetical protein
MEHTVVTWFGKILTISCKSTVSRFKFSVHIFTTDMFEFHFNIIVSFRTRYNCYIVLFLHKIKSNLLLCKWHLLFKFSQKGDRFVTLFHHISLLLLFWTGLFVFSSWISPHPDLLQAANRKHAAMYIYIYIYLPPNSPIYAWVFQVDSFPQVPSPKPCIHISPHTYYMSRPSHFSQFYHPNSNRWGVQIIKLLFIFPYIDINTKKKLYNCARLPVSTAMTH